MGSWDRKPRRGEAGGETPRGRGAGGEGQQPPRAGGRRHSTALLCQQDAALSEQRQAQHAGPPPEKLQVHGTWLGHRGPTLPRGLGQYLAKGINVGSGGFQSTIQLRFEVREEGKAEVTENKIHPRGNCFNPFPKWLIIPL